MENDINTSFGYRQVKQESSIVIPLKSAIWKKHGIFPQSNTLLHDPRLDLPEHNFFNADIDYSANSYYYPDAKEQLSLKPTEPEHFLMRFDAREDIPKQLKVAKDALKLLRKKFGKAHEGNLVADDIYIKYIRTLDALASGFSPENNINEFVQTIDPELWEVWSAGETDTSLSNYVASWIRESSELCTKKYKTLLRK